MTNPWFPSVLALRWRGYRTWHRFHIGPLCFSLWVYPPGEPFGWRGTRIFVTRSWRYVSRDGVGRHTRTFRLWLRVRKGPSVR